MMTIIALYRIISHYIAFYRIISHYIALYRKILNQKKIDLKFKY